MRHRDDPDEVGVPPDATFRRAPITTREIQSSRFAKRFAAELAMSFGSQHGFAGTGMSSRLSAGGGPTLTSYARVVHDVQSGWQRFGATIAANDKLAAENMKRHEAAMASRGRVATALRGCGLSCLVSLLWMGSTKVGAADHLAARVPAAEGPADKRHAGSTKWRKAVDVVKTEKEAPNVEVVGPPLPIGDRCFVTFRYADDAEQARAAWRSWDSLGSLLSTAVMAVALTLLGALLGPLIPANIFPRNPRAALGAMLGFAVAITFGPGDPFQVSLRLRRYRSLDYPEGPVGVVVIALIGGFVGLIVGGYEGPAFGVSESAGALFGLLVGTAAGAGAGACYARLEGLPLKPPGCCGKHPRQVALGAGTLHVTRPKEPEDLIWENLQYEGSACRRWLMPAVNWVLVVVILYCIADVLLKLTAAKMKLTEKLSSGEVTDAVEYFESVTHVADEGSLVDSEFQSLVEAAVKWLAGHGISPEKGITYIMSASIVVLNVVAKVGLKLLIGFEKHGSHTARENKMMVASAAVYIFNYVLLMLRVHSPLPPGQTYFDILINSTSIAIYDANGETIDACFGSGAEERSVVGDAVVGYGHWVGECVSSSFHAAYVVFCTVMQAFAMRLSNVGWYEATGVVPQMIVIALTDIVLLVLLSEISAIGLMLLKRLLARCKSAQLSINAWFRPPEWIFADRYAHMLKLVAVVMCFGPAAPVLYFIGGISLLLSVTIQKFMLLKVYARPRPLDDALAWRSRGFLQALFFLHVTMAPLFYAERFHAILAATAVAKDSSKVAALQWYPGTTLAALDVAESMNWPLHPPPITCK